MTTANTNSNQTEIRYLTPMSSDVKKKKYCRFKKSGIKYIDYKDPEFLKKFSLTIFFALLFIGSACAIAF